MRASIQTIKRITIASFAISALAVALFVAQPSPAAKAAVDDSAATFKTKCASCHGLDGSGNTAVGKKLAVRDLRSAEVRKMTDAQMTTIITKGKGKMPASKLTADQAKEMVAYIRSLK